MNKSKIYMAFSLIITISLILTAIYINCFKKIDFIPLIKEITSKTKLIDYNTDHNQALDVIEHARQKDIKIPQIMVNFDTHSDIIINFPTVSNGKSNIENWINEYIAKNPEVDEIYWVMPDKEARNFRIQLSLSEPRLEGIENGAPLAGNIIDERFPRTQFIFKPLYKEPFIQEFLIDPQTGKMNEYIEDLEITKTFFDPTISYKKVKIITCTEKTLPDFTGKEVFLSIDADYISNSGFDTDEDWTNNLTEKEMLAELFKIFTTIKNKNIRPEIISLSLSPQYLPQEDHRFMTKFFNYVIQESGNIDEIHTYKNKFNNDNIIPYQIKNIRSDFGKN